MNTSIRWESFWFKQVPGYRLACFRVAVAATTIIFVIPRLDGAIHSYLASSFHTPMLSWIPPLPAHTERALALAEYAAAACLLLGFLPRLSAGFLAASGLYIFLLDTRHYSHWGQFHLILLALLACSKARFSLLRLFQKDKALPTCEAWPEHLIRLQLSILLFYTALDKVFSPYWGTSGMFFTYEFDALTRRIAPSLLSSATIGLEFFLAMSFLFRPLWRMAVPLGFLFAAALQFFIGPITFAWDFMAVLILFL